MLLNALWSGACRALNTAPTSCQIVSQSIGFPVVFLQRRDTRAPRVSVFSEDSSLGLSLSVADVVHQELGLSIPFGASIVVLGQSGAQGNELGMEVLAELLHAVIHQSGESFPLSLMAWSFLSLSASWGWSSDDSSFLRSRDTVLAKVLGYPAERAELSMVAYLALAEPGSTLPPLESGLAQRLMQCTSQQDWLQSLRADFAAACRAQSLARN